jgi:GNAT superfamily N-acetyltransferase
MDLVQTIWPEAFEPIIGAKQVAYMLEEYQSERVIREQMAAGAEYFLVQSDGCNAGYLAWEVQGDTLFISKVYLLAQMRGRGIAGWILDRCEQEARTRGLRRMMLHVNRGNAQALAVYKHKGFTVFDEVDEPIGEFTLNDYHMEKIIA